MTTRLLTTVAISKRARLTPCIILYAHPSWVLLGCQCSCPPHAAESRRSPSTLSSSPQGCCRVSSQIDLHHGHLVRRQQPCGLGDIPGAAAGGGVRIESSISDQQRGTARGGDERVLFCVVLCCVVLFLATYVVEQEPTASGALRHCALA
jgi:hypothetical protein